MLFQQWWIWAVAGLVLAIIEVIVPGYIFLGFAVGAVVVGLALLVSGWIGLGPVTIAPLLLLFAVASLIGWLVVRKVMGVRSGQVKIWETDINEN